MAYLSCIASGDVAFPRRIFKCQWEETFENILVRLKADRESRSTVLKTEFSATDIFHPAHIVDLDTPVHVCQQFSCYNVRFTISNQDDTCSRTSVRDALPTNSEDIVVPRYCCSKILLFQDIVVPSLQLPSPQLPSEMKQLCNDQRLYNDIIG